MSLQSLINKIKALPPDRIAEVEAFVEFISARAQDRALTRAATQVSAPAFTKLWNNPEDDAYDAL